MFNQPARPGNGRGKAKLAFAVGAVVLVTISSLAVASADTQTGFTTDANGCGTATGPSSGLQVMNSSPACAGAEAVAPAAATTPVAATPAATATAPAATAPMVTATQQNVATALPTNPTSMAVAPAQAVTTPVTMPTPVAAPAAQPVQAAAVATAAPVTALSRNWSGYEAQSQTGFGGASGTWTEPAGSCTNPATGVVGYWVGLDGFGADAKGVEQTGTAFSCANGVATEYAWYEFFPAPPVYLPMDTYPVAGGDVINASIVNNNGLFNLTLTDISPSHAAWSFATSATANAPATSAEWVIETPGSADGANAILPNFGNITFSNCSATLNGSATPVSALTPERLLLAPKGANTQTAVSGLDTTGSAFNISFTQ